jgi:hypothetical protein
MSSYERMRDTNIIFIAHIQWIEEELIKAVRLAPPSLTLSIRIFISGSTAASQSDLSGEDDFTLSRAAVEKKGITEPSVVTQGDTLPSSLSSLGGTEVKQGRADLDALLNEEVNMTSGRMSVSGEYTSPRNAQVTDIPPVCGSRGIARAVRHALRFPECGPSNILSGGPSVTLHVTPFGYA